MKKSIATAALVISLIVVGCNDNAATPSPTAEAQAIEAVESAVAEEVEAVESAAAEEIAAIESAAAEASPAS